ncbi:K02A2.6-like [Cordylochernes scorpioides]|uniref:RNA-directed DNA polymerase n=1 Tax=Cordylochernes scorpioides TaxID=51811 RepID=A0ABY6LID0_9ARAC|nr:K02A2.6-like [Cordylochernes scorpioides]
MKLEELRGKNIPASDDIVYTFNQRILEAMSSAKITYSIKGGPRKSKPWFDKDCYDMKKLAKESLKKYRKTNRLEDRDCYASSRKKYIALLDLKRKGFDNEKQEILRNAKDSKTFWKIIALYKSTSIIQGEIAIQDWLNFYRELMTTEKNLNICNLHNVISQNDPILDTEITNADIYKEIAGLKSNKACGPDGIPNEVLKIIPDSYILLLKQLYNSVMTTGKYPAIWTNSTIHPIFKNGYKNSPSNYRGIALISKVSKLFTSILRSRLEEWVEGRRVVPENQAGFRKGRSCIDHIFQVLALLSGYGEMFTAPDEYKGRTHLVKHQIKTTSDIPIRKNPYRVSLKERNIISDQINSMLKNGIISHSSSVWASPIILVKKKNGTFRFCVDYRNLNSVTVKDQYPLPRIDDCFDSLHGARYFTSLDLCSGYWQVEVEEQDREKTAFITPDGLYQFNVLPFGLCNGPATFERLMDTVLRTHKWKICLCYLDDVIIFSEDLHSHLNRLKTILECLKTAGLTLNASKCRFAYTELLILGHVVSNEGIAPDPEKIISIRKFPTPRTVKDVRAFLGLCSYYRRFIREFSKVALPLQILTRKNHSFAWGEEQELSFNSLKNKLISPEVLTHYDPNKPIGLHTDASDQGLGAVLVHLNENTKERPISYASRTLQKAETNYSTTKKECLAIIWAIKKFRPYLYGRKFTIYTDHHSLCWMAKMKNPAGRLARWSLELQEYDFAIKYKSGKTHLDADGLSRCPIPERIISTINYEEHDYDSYIKKIDNLVNQNPNSYGENFTKFKEKLFKKHPSVTGDPWLLIVPKNKQKELLENMHDHPTSGHMGIKRTYNRLKSKYFWPSMLKTVEEYVSSCPECQFRKTPSQLPQGLLQPIPPASRPFEKMGIDLMGRFPKSGRGNSWILIYRDSGITPRDGGRNCRLFLQKVVLRHGAPKTVISDRGSCFLSKLFKEVLKICNTLHKKTTSYHPQTNGQTERMTRTLADMMAMYIDERHQNWDEILPFVTFAYNSSIQDTTGYSPYFLIHGREPLTFLDSTFDMPELSRHKDYDEYVSNLLEIIEDAKEISTSKTIARQNKSKQLYDKTHREVKYAFNDLVLIWTPIRKVGRADKLQRRYIGPYQILRQTSPVNYEVIEIAEGKRKKRQIVHNSPSNYRGIALISNVSKLFTSILRSRLEEWVEGRRVVPENQAGFRKGRSCIDHIFTLTTLIQLSLRKKRGKLYVFFIDLRKAFDTVPHSILWKKLYNLGISYQFISTIRSYYEQATIAIRWKGSFTESIKINSGVLQGEPLSPLLFILFITDLIEIYNNSDLPSVNLPEFGDIHLLLYADDIAIIGESRMNLQKKIKILKEYLDENLMTLNETKSKIMVFRNGGKPSNKD